MLEYVLELCYIKWNYVSGDEIFYTSSFLQYKRCRATRNTVLKLKLFVYFFFALYKIYS